MLHHPRAAPMLNEERIQWIKKNEAWVGPEIGEDLFPIGWVCCTPFIPWVRGKTWEEAIDNCERELRTPSTPVTGPRTAMPGKQAA